MNRVAVTGISALCGLGSSLTEVWNRLVQGESAITRLEVEEAHASPIHIGGVVRDFKISDELLDPKEQERFDRFIHFALHCTDEAIKQSGLLDAKIDPNHIGAILGTGLGGFPAIERTHKTFLEKGARRVSPFFIPSFIPNMATGKISMKYDFKGINYTVSSACASAAHAIGAGATEIMLGRQTAMIVGGAEAVLSDLPYAGFNAMKALSRNTGDPAKVSRPFDKGRDGFVMGEGAGILILENLEHAKARGAKILAEVVGFGATSDAYHITAPHPQGLGTIPCMQQALNMAKVSAQQVGYINAHGTSTPIGDVAETKAIKAVFKEHARKLNVSSTKSMTGHLLGAAGGLESVICIQTLIEGVIPPTINLDEPDEECDLNYTANQAQKREIEYALNNSFGFGGTNSTTLFKKYRG